MEINITAEEFGTKRVMVGTPMYAGQCSGYYTKSVVELVRMGYKYGLALDFYSLFNESLITRARNYIADVFLRSTCTHLMFIDADIHFDPTDVLVLAGLASPGSAYDVICGPYPKKTIAWEKITRAVRGGFADEDPTRLEEYVGDYVFNLAGDKRSFKLDEPVEVMEGGTGFMMIPRETLEDLAAVTPEMRYLPDHSRSGSAFDGSREIHCFFDTTIDEETRRYLSEDYNFCRTVRRHGMRVWMCPWMKLSHVGMYEFGGSLAALSQIGATPTDDPKPRG